MKKVKDVADVAPEIAAIGAVHAALKGLDSAAQARVLRYAAEMLKISIDLPNVVKKGTVEREFELTEDPNPSVITPPLPDSHGEENVEGISAIGIKWMKRSSLDPKSLQTLFSLGIDDIDLVAKKVPGKSKRERMHSVILLKAIAAYLGTGVPRVMHEQMKQACLHYDAYDATNAAAYLKAFSSEVGGTKDAGYTLTPRGLTTATELVQGMLTPTK